MLEGLLVLSNMAHIRAQHVREEGEWALALESLYLTRANGQPLADKGKGLGVLPWARRVRAAHAIAKDPAWKRPPTAKERLLSLLLMAVRDVKDADGDLGRWPAHLAEVLVDALVAGTVKLSRGRSPKGLSVSAIAARIATALSSRDRPGRGKKSQTDESTCVAILVAAGCTVAHAQGVVYKNTM